MRARGRSFVCSAAEAQVVSAILGLTPGVRGVPHARLCRCPSPSVLARILPSRREGPMPVSRLRAALMGVCTVLVSASFALAADPYYKGKRLSIMVNYAAGGPTDIEGRLFARHIVRHLDGQPNIIVQNIDGAGGLTGTTWLGEIAPKDGTAMGYLTGAAWLYASEPERHRADFRS